MPTGFQATGDGADAPACFWLDAYVMPASSIAVITMKTDALKRIRHLLTAAAILPDHLEQVCAQLNIP